ncbi:MAG TPA: hypothetical protein VE955_10500, partial [Candidatus Dormibacteraeota bacterium]|nr:hypothetical protein [Candidatus Dormibacteraeota bacterium]
MSKADRFRREGIPLLFITLCVLSVVLVTSFRPASATNGTVLPATSFQVVSGTMSGQSDSSISVSTPRMRAITISPMTVPSVREDFVITSPTSTLNTDVDGVTRIGMTIWTNVQDQCNQYFISWRSMSNQPAGTSIVSAYLVYNPGLTTLSQCPGTGFTLLTDTGTATNAWKSLPIDILDGKQHSLLAVRIAGQTTGFDVYADGSLVFTAVDKSNTLTDTGLLGARTDNSVVNFFYSVGTPVSSTDFALVATQPTTNTIGQSATTTVGITAFNGFSGNVALTDSSPSGLSCGSPSSTTIAGSETASITCSTSNAGIYTLTIRGSSGSLVRSTTATFSFSDFAVSASPATLSMNPGGQAISTISLNLLNGFSSTVTLAISNPAGTSASLSQTNISAMGSSTLTITSTTPGSYNVVITGTSGTLTRTITVKVTVGTVSTSVAIDAPSTLTVVQTKTASFAVTATDVV